MLHQKRVTPNDDSKLIRAGDWVCIENPNVIIGSLDQNARTAGVPFMPEMAVLCGQKLQVRKVASNVCVDNSVRYLGDCYVLNTLARCDGSAHGGCQFGCSFLWRPEWLALADKSEQKQTNREAHFANQSHPSLGKLLEITNAGAVNTSGMTKLSFACQATELHHISEPLSITQLQQYKDSLNLNRTRITQLFRFFVYLICKKLLRKSDNLVGSCIRTPIQDLGLAVGDSVRVKSIEQIRETLDSQGCNRGLWFDREEMAAYCGQELTVSRRIERIIDEKTGHIIQLKVPSVVLAEAECTGFFRRFCSRGMLFMWRECWLEQI